MNKWIGTAALLCLCGLFSCKKDDSGNPNTTTPTAKVYDVTASLGRNHTLDGSREDDIAALTYADQYTKDTIYSVSLNGGAIPRDAQGVFEKSYPLSGIDYNGPVHWQLRLKYSESELSFDYNIPMPTMELTLPDTISKSRGLSIPYSATGSSTSFTMYTGKGVFSGEGKGGVLTIKAEDLQNATLDSFVSVYFTTVNNAFPAAGNYKMDFNKYYSVSKNFICKP